jgi:hypothetical protein
LTLTYVRRLTQAILLEVNLVFISKLIVFISVNFDINRRVVYCLYNINTVDKTSSKDEALWFTPLCSVDVGEALGLYHAIRWIHELQLENVDFEVDSKRVADYFNKGRGDVTEFGSIMDSSIQFCRSFLTNSHVEFIRRQANEVAHTLAKTAISSSSFRTFDEIPTYITELIFNEMI